MNKYILSCCSTADLSKEHFNQRNINYVRFHYYLNGKHYFDDLGESLSYEEFYNTLSEGADTSTSLVNVDEFIDYFTPFLQQGLDILHITLSSGLSGVINSATIAKEFLLEQFPNRRIFIVDSLGASSGYGLLMDRLADLRDAGMDIESLYDWANEHKLKLHHWFFSTDLAYYLKGGRIGKISGYIGTLLKICPLLNVNEIGQLVPRHKIKGKNKVIKEIVNKMEQYAIDGVEYSDKCYISHAGCYEDAVTVAKLVTQRFPQLNGEVQINNVGTTIGSHTGPNTIALFFWGEKRNK